jgi:hypothetical protein
MSIADELRNLEDLHQTGALSDEEFAQAKAAVLSGTALPSGSAGSEKPLFPIDPYDGLTPGRMLALRIVAGSLVLGVVIFLVIVLYLVQVQHLGRDTRPPGALPVLSLVAAALLLIQGLLSFVLPNLMTRAALRRILAGTWAPPPGAPPALYATGGAKLMAVRQTTLIVGLALVESVALLGGIAYLVEAQPLALVVVGVALVLMLGRFPNETGVRSWLKQQADTLTDLRHTRGDIRDRRG